MMQADEKTSFILWRDTRPNRLLATLICLLVLSSVAVARDPESYDDLDQPVNTDPLLFIPPPVRAFDKGLPELWTSALVGPERDIRRRSAQTIEMARTAGMPGLEMAIPNLVALMKDDNEDALVRFAAVRALVALDAQSEADAIHRAAVGLGSDAEAEAAAALARWRHAGTRDVWRQRIGSPQTAHRDLLLAINGLAAMEDRAVAEQLKQMITDPFTNFDVRIAAARALASLEQQGLEPLANQLISAETPHRRQRILAASLLRHQAGSAAEDLLEKLSLDPEPTAAGAALERLIEVAPARITQHHEQLLQSRDANVRRWTVQALALFPSEFHSGVLARVTNDPNPGIRVLARNTLLTFAQEHNLRDAVLKEADRLLREADWRGIEQACRLAGSLDHKPAAAALIKILPHRRIEAHATAAWALRHLAIPETLPEVLTFAEATTAQAMKDVPPDDPLRNYDPLLIQLFQFFGEMKYLPADAVLRRYVPKLSMTEESRSAAIWALGHIHKENPPEDLVQALDGRLLDAASVPPEFPKVRQQCAVALGRMQAKETLPSLRRFYEESGPYTSVGYGCGWAIEQITGEPVEKPKPTLDYLSGWFLVPLR